MRRAPAPDPPAASAVWSRRAALLGLAGVGMAVVGSHAGWLAPRAALALLALGLLLGVAAVLLAMVAAVVVWRTGVPGAGRLAGGLGLALLLLGGPAALVAPAWHRPAINDVSTDLADPPAFAAAPAARAGAVHPQPQPDTLRVQAAAYPDVQPLALDVAPSDAYVLALKLVRARRWTVLASRPPAPPAREGQIEAVARTSWMRFRDDVAIRVRTGEGGGARVDMRSASRLGARDLGANAARVAAFLADLDDAADAD